MSKSIQCLCVMFVLVLPTIISAQIWVVRYNGPYNGHDQAHAIAIDDSNNIYITGYSVGIGSSCDYATVRYNPDGVEQWVVRYNGPANGMDEAWAITLDSLSNVYITGYSVGLGSSFDYATIKYSSPHAVEENNVHVKYNDSGATIINGPLPLPEGKNCRIFDITGRVIAPDKVKPGIYFIEIDDKITKKVVKIR